VGAFNIAVDAGAAGTALLGLLDVLGRRRMLPVLDLATGGC
jgi:hypothetical protein